MQRCATAGPPIHHKPLPGRAATRRAVGSAADGESRARLGTHSIALRTWQLVAARITEPGELRANQGCPGTEHEWHPLAALRAPADRSNGAAPGPAPPSNARWLPGSPVVERC